MTILSSKKILESFLKTNFNILSANYPGINLRRLLWEMQEEIPCDQSLISHQSFHEDFFVFFEKLKRGMLEGVPLEYIFNRSSFLGVNFYVDSRVLIPRQESEMLVDEALRFIHSCGKKSLKCLDIGVGSGVLGLSVLIQAHGHIHSLTGVDISESALAVALLNQKKLSHYWPYSVEIKWIKADRLNFNHQTYDLILSNPPYIKSSRMSEVHPQVRKFEPASALFLPDNQYLDWFNLFFKQVKTALNAGGIFLMEGHELELSELAILAKQFFKQVELLQDLTSSPRFLRISDVFA